MIPALLLPGIRKACQAAGAKASLETNFKTSALMLRVRKGSRETVHQLFSDAELKDGSYKKLIYPRLEEIFGLGENK